MKYAVLIQSQFSSQAKLLRLNYSGSHYEEIASGEYRELTTLASMLNRQAEAS